ncbi:MAG: hypothetical protein R2722_08620 [Tessaracoccus sp.]
MNAAKYAPAKALEIVIARDSDSVALSARNRLPAQRPDSAIGTGHRLTGVAEHAALLGGSTTHGPTPDDHLEVTVRLPWH